MSFAGKWMELELMLSEIDQSHKDKHYMFSFISRVLGKRGMKVKGEIIRNVGKMGIRKDKRGGVHTVKVHYMCI
jgi:hypothetical protein